MIGRDIAIPDHGCDLATAEMAGRRAGCRNIQASDALAAGIGPAVVRPAVPGTGLFRAGASWTWNEPGHLRLRVDE